MRARVSEDSRVPLCFSFRVFRVFRGFFCLPPVNRAIPSVAGAFGRSHACGKDNAGRVALLSGIEEQAGPR
jgi:hypothetical protein